MLTAYQKHVQTQEATCGHWAMMLLQFGERAGWNQLLMYGGPDQVPVQPTIHMTSF